MVTVGNPGNSPDIPNYATNYIGFRLEIPLHPCPSRSPKSTPPLAQVPSHSLPGCWQYLSRGGAAAVWLLGRAERLCPTDKDNRAWHRKVSGPRRFKGGSVSRLKADARPIPASAWRKGEKGR